MEDESNIMKYPVYNMVIYTMNSEQIKEIHRRLKGMTYASSVEITLAKQ